MENKVKPVKDGPRRPRKTKEKSTKQVIIEHLKANEDNSLEIENYKEQIEALNAKLTFYTEALKDSEANIADLTVKLEICKSTALRNDKRVLELQSLFEEHKQLYFKIPKWIRNLFGAR